MTIPSATARVRMYRLNELGDCFLLTFVADGKTSRVLIDCGSFRNGEPSARRLREIVSHIGEELGGTPLDVVVGTHQHNDHLSGFVHAKAEFEKRVSVERVWLSWLDNPNDKDAQRVAEKFGNVLTALKTARTRLRATGAGARNRSVERLNDVLGFYEGPRGARRPPVLPADALERLRTMARTETKYLAPGQILDLPNLPKGAVRVYVLGPPRAASDLYDTTPSASESYDKHLNRAGAAAQRFLNAVQYRGREAAGAESHFPFHESLKRRAKDRSSPELRELQSRYASAAARWRNIDEDWLAQAESLALFLDTYTNNSSLVLAFELVASGKVLLFAADAQTGNWRSWSGVTWAAAGVSAADLLARTVLYKVGHHGSHNATLVDALEAMKSEDLVALIPVHKKDPNITKKGGWRMPATGLFKRLREKTKNRVLQMDDDNPATCNPRKQESKEAWKSAGITPVIDDLYIELEIKG